MLNFKSATAIVAPFLVAGLTYWTISQHYEARLQNLRADLTEQAAKQRAQLEARAASEKAVCQLIKEEHDQAITTADNNVADLARLRQQLQNSACCVLPQTTSAATGANGTTCCRLLTEVAELASESADAADRYAIKLKGLQKWARTVAEEN